MLPGDTVWVTTLRRENAPGRPGDGLATGAGKTTGFLAVLAAVIVIAGGLAAFHFRGRLHHLAMSRMNFASKAMAAPACDAYAFGDPAPGAIAAMNPCDYGVMAQNVPTQAQQGSAMHSIEVKFDYDFTHEPVCGGKVKDACIAKFNVYDISGPKPYSLFTIPAPAGAKGMVKGITATSPRMLFAVGKHRIAVAAVMANGKESPPRECNTIVDIKPPDPGSKPPAQ
jgi:hypothetical protein